MLLKDSGCAHLQCPDHFFNGSEIQFCATARRFHTPYLCAGDRRHILRMDYTALSEFISQACLPPEGSVMELGYDPLRAFGGILGSSGSTPAAAMIARPNSSAETVNPPPVSEMGTTACPSPLVAATKR